MAIIETAGFIDLAVRAKNLSDAQAAAEQSGCSQYCLQPNSLNPIIDEAAAAEALHKRIEQCAPGALMLGAVTQNLAGKQLAEMAALKKAGCIALTDAGRPWQSNRTLKRAMEYAHSIGITLHLTAQDRELADDGCAHAGAVAAQLGLPGSPSSSESGALAMMLELVEETGARVHFCRLSTERSVKLIQRAKKRGLPVTADVSIHNLVLTEEALRGYNTLCHVQPPLRSNADRLALIAGVNAGTIDAITSHHQPCTEDEKLQPFPSSRQGIAALDILLPLTLTLCLQGELEQAAALHALSEGPATVLGISVPQPIRIDDSQEVVVCDLLSPYRDWPLKGSVQSYV